MEDEELSDTLTDKNREYHESHERYIGNTFYQGFSGVRYLILLSKHMNLRDAIFLPASEKCTSTTCC
jgi:hypothetical protein